MGNEIHFSGAWNILYLCTYSAPAPAAPGMAGVSAPSRKFRTADDVEKMAAIMQTVATSLLSCFPLYHQSVRNQFIHSFY